MRKDNNLRYELQKTKRSFVAIKRLVCGAVSLHSHAYYELEIVTGGVGTLHVNGKAHSLHAGHVHLAGPMDYHKVTDCGEGMELYNVSFSSDGKLTELIEKAFGNPLVKVVELPESDLDDCRRLCEIIIAEQSNDASDNVAELCFEALLKKLARYVPKGGEQNAHAARAVRYIQEHFTEELTLSDVAREAGFSDSYLSALLKRVMGTGFKQYLTLLRITHAKHLLETTDMTATDVCFECGFRSYSGFYRAFEKTTGQPPNKFASE